MYMVAMHGVAQDVVAYTERDCFYAGSFRYTRPKSYMLSKEMHIFNLHAVAQYNILCG